MPNPLIGHDDPYYHNHNPDAKVDEEWFQGRDGWDQTSLTLKKKKSPRNVFKRSILILHSNKSSPLSEAYLRKPTGPLHGWILVVQLQHLVTRASTLDECAPYPDMP